MQLLYQRGGKGGLFYCSKSMAKTRIARLKQNKQFAELFDAMNAEHSGVMIALYPPATVAQQLAALDGAETKAEDMHLTLCCCGDSATLTDTQIAGAILATEQMSRCYNPLTGTIGGMGRFNASNSSDGKDVVVALVDVPELEDFQDDICDELEECGCAVLENHGFTPHITLAYIEPGSGFSLPSFDSIPVTFATLSVVVADKRVDFPMRAELTMQQAEGMEEAEPYAELPKEAYLVVEDPAKSTTWHLPVKTASGSIDNAKLGAAWAALHGGYRGNKYDGPNKTQAIKKAKALYKQLGRTPPGESAKKDMAEMCSADGGIWQLFNEFAESPEWIAYMPTPGKFKHPAYGEVNITKERNAEFVNNFKAAVYQDRLPIDAEHETKLSGAVGWVSDMRLNEKGGVEAKVDWTDRGKTMLANNRFKYFSPEFFDTWNDPATGAKHANVAIGGALTTRPFFKQNSLRPLVASERGLFAAKDDTSSPNVVFEQFKEVRPMADETITVAPVDAKAFTDLQHQFGELKDKLAKAESEANEAKANAQKFQEVLDLSNKRVAELERAAQVKRFNEIVAGKNGKRWIGDATKHVATLTKFADVFGENSADFKEYVEQQSATTEQLYASQAFTEVGTDTQASAQTAWQKIQAIATRKMSEEKITMAVAVDRATIENPELYKLYLEGK